MKHLHLFLVAVLALVLVNACSDDDSTSPATTGTLVVRLTDAPVTYDEINITFSEIAVSMNGGWVSLPLATSETINLLEWNNGNSIVIGQADISPGKVTQIRLLIEDATIVVDGTTHPLEIPSGMQSGLKLNAKFDIVVGITYELVLDFNAEKSVVETGNGKYKLQPVIRVQAVANTGSFSGIVSNPDENPIARAFDSNNVEITSTPPDASTGAFKLSFLTPGTYKVVIEDDLGRSYTQDGIDVVAGEDTDIGTVILI
jgi:uncharacterized protein DUF4382